MGFIMLFISLALLGSCSADESQASSRPAIIETSCADSEMHFVDCIAAGLSTSNVSSVGLTQPSHR